MNNEHDIFIVGGGINGCGIARDAAGRGFSVCLAEMNDLGSGTSSWSSKLIHGGLRYLEHYEFRLVRESLSERETLLSIAPHIIWPMRFVLPHHNGLRPAWLLRLGLFLYDHIGQRKLLAGTKVLDLTSDIVGKPLKALFKKGFEYSDCWVDDARLVVLNAMDAASKGADINMRMKVISAERIDDHWSILCEDLDTGKQVTHRAKLLINAAGPWVDDVIKVSQKSNRQDNVRLVQGSHIIVPKLTDHDKAYIFQNADGRIIFVLPYQGDYSLIGTTDRDFSGNPSEVHISTDEVEYLCQAASEYFKDEISSDDIVWQYSGVRPLYDDGASAAQEATRDYVLQEDHGDMANAPLAINIFGGKITTYRRLAETMLGKIETILGKRGASWTGLAPLPGGDFPADGFDDLVCQIIEKYSFINASIIEKYVRRYGTNTWTILQDVYSEADLGLDFGHDLFEAEVLYLMKHEWAKSSDDVIWRRTKIGITMSEKEKQRLGDWMSDIHV